MKPIMHKNSQRKKPNHRYKTDWKLADMYKHYKKENEKSTLSHGEYAKVINKFNQKVVDLLFDNYKFKLPFGLGELSIRKRKTNLGNFKRLKLDFGHFNKTGEKKKHFNMETGLFYYLFYWKKGKVTNVGYYRLKMSRTNCRRVPVELSNGKDYFEVP